MTIIHQEAILSRIETQKEINWDRLMSDVVDKYGMIAREKVLETKVINSFNKLTRSFSSEDINNLISGADEWFNMENSILTSADGINNCAWLVFENISEKSSLEKAISWCEKALLIESENAYNIDTYANLLHKVGRTAEAITWEKKAVSLKPDEQVLKDTLAKMEAGNKTWRVPEDDKK